jgi:hypothetical protein
MNLIQKDPQGNFYQIGEDGRLTDITADEAGEFIKEALEAAFEDTLNNYV